MLRPTCMLQHFPLTSAYLCQDCNSIGNNANQCPACASEVLMSLSAVLNRSNDSMMESEYPSLPALAVASVARVRLWLPRILHVSLVYARPARD